MAGKQFVTEMRLKILFKCHKSAVSIESNKLLNELGISVTIWTAPYGFQLSSQAFIAYQNSPLRRSVHPAAETIENELKIKTYKNAPHAIFNYFRLDHR